MSSTLTTVRSKAEAVAGLVKVRNDEFTSFMGTYNALFQDSPESTLADHEAGRPLEGYAQGSSPELAQYYKLIHMMCTLGSVEKMYMPPTIDASTTVKQNQVLLERELASNLDVAPGATVLDLGCGCGAIAEHVAELCDATVYGINLEPSQIEKAWQIEDRARLHFQVGDFNQPLPFGDEMFDAVYNVQALTYATDLTSTFKEAFRVLKPGGRLVTNDVAALDAYDRTDERHRLLIQHTRELTAFGGFWHYRYWEDALTDAGFEVLDSKGRPAVEMIRQENARYDRLNQVFGALARARLMPSRVDTMLRRMNTNCASYIQAEEEGLLTLNWKLVARKPA